MNFEMTALLCLLYTYALLVKFDLKFYSILSTLTNPKILKEVLELVFFFSIWRLEKSFLIETLISIISDFSC